MSDADRKTGQHLVLDGHLRLQAAKDLGLTEVACLLSTDDETFTYNNHISRLATIQEHLMIRRALDRGISAAKLAKGLCVDISLVNKKSSLLDVNRPGFGRQLGVFRKRDCGWHYEAIRKGPSVRLFQSHLA